MDVGIVTHYYKSVNYGGNLQAYALCKALEKLGVQSQQICITEQNIVNLPKNTRKRTIKNPIKIAKKSIAFILRKAESKRIQIKQKKAIKRYNFLKRRAEAFRSFNLEIPHSDEIYSIKNINEVNSKYDMIITGSDQVWNLTWMPEIFLLTFLSETEKKLSYAASIPMLSLTDEQKEIFKKNLTNFKAISVREESSVNLLSGIVKAEQVLDPTLLLSAEEWNQVCEEIQIGEKYMFCYFLGTNKKAYNVARKYAKAKNLKIVNIPFAGGKARVNDAKFGDYNLLDVSPRQFIGLIKKASYIFTDSFHAVVFSHIYKKQYFVFNRSKKEEMNSRIYSITRLFKTEERFCKNEKETRLEHLNKIGNIDYNRELVELEKMKEYSINFLKRNLK